MKKISKLLLLLTLVLVTLFAVTACGDEGVLSVKEDRMPQLVHVLGEELDLSSGVLLLTDDETTREIAMSDEGVEISGYDKNTLGEQTVTIRYNESETTLKVTVVPRMTIDGFTADYLEGDAFDTSNGTLKITRNDGTSFTVILKSDKVSVEGFDSTAAGDLSLTAKYTNAGTVYECSFSVKVHAIQNVTFKAPTKVTYNSHDGVLDVAGGYFTLSGKDGALKRDVPLTAEMVKGFDISAVNETNSPLTQKLTVTYDEKDYEYSVKLTYTDISLFKKNAAPLLDLDWSGSSEEEPEITEAQGTVALAMIEKYLQMSPAERKFITAEETLAVARAAMSYGFSAWADEIMKYNDAFAIEYGEMVFKCESREALETAIEGLCDTTTPLYTYSPILLAMMEAFAEENVNSDYLFADYPVLSVETYMGLVSVFEYMLELDTLVDQVPDTWTVEGVQAYADEIEAVYSSIVGGGYMDYTFRELFYYISYWRPNDDMFDFLYEYYFSTEDIEALTNLSMVRFPGQLEELYGYLVVALDQINQMSSYGVTDTSEFMYNYHMALRLADQLRNSDDEMIRYLYENLAINAMLGIESDVGLGFETMLTYLRTVEGGFYYYSGALLGVEAYHALMNKYMNIVINLFEDDAYADSAEYNADIEEMFVLYTNLSSSAQFNFLGTLNAFYGMGLPPLAFDDAEEYASFTCVFVQLINEYFVDKFTEEVAKNAYMDLVLAIELYAQRYTNENWLSDFTAKMDAIAAVYDENKMSEQDKAIFDQYLLAVYTKYVNIRAKFIESTNTPDLGDWADEFKALEDAVVDVELFYMFIEEGYALYNLYFSAFEKAEKLANNIVAIAPPEILEIYYNAPLYSTNELLKRLDPDADLSDVEDICWSYDYVMSVYRGMYISYLLNFNETCIYDIYVETGLGSVLEKYNELVWVYLNSEDGEEIPFDKAEVLAFMEGFANLKVEGQMLFILLDEISGDSESVYYYYIALEAFLVQEYGEEGNLIHAITKLIEVEQLYMFYETYQDAEILAELDVALTALKTLYGELAGEDLAIFENDFGNIYAIDVNKCEAAIEAAAEQETAN